MLRKSFLMFRLSSKQLDFKLKYLVNLKVFFRRHYLLSYPAAEETCRSVEPRSHLPSVHSVQEVVVTVITVIIVVIVFVPR